MAHSDLKYALEKRRSVRQFLDKPIDANHLGKILFALGGTTSSEGKRTVPSANGLYSVSAFVSVGLGNDPAPGVYQLVQARQELEKKSNTDLRQKIAGAAIGDQSWIQESACIISLFGDIQVATDTFFEQPPKGQRGERYTYIEAGAAAQNAMLQATSLGIGSVLVGGIDEQATANAYAEWASGRPLLHICLGWPA